MAKRILIYSHSWQIALLVSEVVATLELQLAVALTREEFDRLTERVIYDLVIFVGAGLLLAEEGLLGRVRPRPLRRPPIFLLSWQQGEQIVLGVLEGGVDQYMTLPLQPARLRNKVLEVLQR